jgi:hypothetical protein
MQQDNLFQDDAMKKITKIMLFCLQSAFSCLILSALLDGKVAQAAGNIGYGIAIILTIMKVFIITVGLADDDLAARQYKDVEWHVSAVLPYLSLLASGYFILGPIFIFVDGFMFFIANQVNSEAKP